MFENINALLRTLVIGLVLLLAGWWTFFLRGKLNAHETALAEKTTQIEGLSEEVKQKNEEIEGLGEDLAARDLRIEELAREVVHLELDVQALEASLRLLKVDHRLARIEVLEQVAADGDPDQVRTRVRFTELDSEGAPLGRGIEAEVEGRLLYIDTLVIKFGDHFVEGGDALRGTSICLFRRLFGEHQPPHEGIPVDTVGTHPPIYGGDNLPDPLYGELWSRFWEYANDPELAREKGVRALHGEAPFIELRAGRSYRVELRSSGGLTIRPEG